jgi:hypothetical protein
MIASPPVRRAEGDRPSPHRPSRRWALPSGESFTFTAHAVHLPRPRIEIAGPQGVQAGFDWQAARDPVLGRMCTATLVNDIEGY